MLDQGLIKIQKLGFALLLSSAFIYSACSYKEMKDVPANDAFAEPTYASLQKKVFKPKCVSCHSGAGAPHGVTCTSYDALLHNGMFPPLVVPGNPEASSLYQVVANGTMPKGQASLSANQLSAIYTWIKNGAKETDAPTSPTPSPTPHEPGCSPGEPGCDDQAGQAPKSQD